MSCVLNSLWFPLLPAGGAGQHADLQLLSLLPGLAGQPGLLVQQLRPSQSGSRRTKLTPPQALPGVCQEGSAHVGQGPVQKVGSYINTQDTNKKGLLFVTLPYIFISLNIYLENLRRHSDIKWLPLFHSLSSPKFANELSWLSHKPEYLIHLLLGWFIHDVSSHPNYEIWCQVDWIDRKNMVVRLCIFLHINQKCPMRRKNKSL